MSRKTDGMPILNRRQAADAGLRVYWNGRPCLKGHEDMRYTASGSCATCAKQYYQGASAIRNSRLATRRGATRVEVFAMPANHAAVIAFAAALDTALAIDGGDPGMAPPPPGVDIVPALPEGSVWTPAEERRAELLAEMDRNARRGGSLDRPIDFANC